MTDQVLVVSATETLSLGAAAPQVLTLAEPGPLELIEVALQGPPGVSVTGALLAANRLSELSADPSVQADARTNLGLAVVDGGTFN